MCLNAFFASNFRCADKIELKLLNSHIIFMLYCVVQISVWIVLK